ncbi:MAG: response regulator, partial [Pirellulales bacterium]|nr:response regulator [Pirellulales bacterium]
PRDLALQEELRSWLGRVQASYQYDRIALFDAAGNTRMLVSDTDEPLSSVTIQKARETLRSEKLTFDDLYRNEHSRKIYLRLFVPILDGRDAEHPIGVVVFRINPNTYVYPFIRRWPTPSSTAETLLLRREGTEVVSLSETKFREKTAITLRLPLDGKGAPAVKAAQAHAGIVEGLDCRGVPVLAAVRTVHGSPWFLVTKIDDAEVYAPMRERFWLTALLVGAFLFGTAAILGLIWRRQQLGLYREKYDVERRYRTILEISADGIMIADVETRMIKYANLAACRMLGYTEEELATMGVADIHPKDALRDILAKFGSQARGEITLAANVPCIRKDGTIVYADINTARDTLDGRAHMVGMFRDTTERRQAEEELRRYAARLESTNKALEEANRLADCATRAKSAFLANMSHEIRTPMTAILGYTDLVMDENIGRATREHVAVIKRNTQHLLELIGDILDLSKIEAGKLQIEPTRCSPVQLVAEVVSLMRTQAAAKPLRLKTELADPLPETVLTDPLRLRQMLVNLVGNAIKFTDQGEVRLAVRLIADNGPPRLRFDVTDTGIGMNEEQIGKLFQPFSQVDSSSTRKFSGTGLGLALSKHLAEALGGSIEVRSTSGKGSTFSVTIDTGPLDGIRMVRGARKAVVQPRPTAASAADKTTLHGRILLAEDGLDNQRLIALLLKKAGAKVTTVENGQIAVEAALAAREASKPFDVILMDMQMPVLDGYGATRQLRSMDYRGPIVALTASAMGPDQQKCLEAGCDDYLSKPFEQHDLLQIAAKHTQASAPDGQRDSVIFDSVEQAGSCPGASGQQP